MNHRHAFSTLACGAALLLGSVFASTPAAAAGDACTLDLTMTQGGTQVVHSDCIESTGAPAEQVIGLCGDLTEMGESMVGMSMGDGGSIESVDMSRVASCPAGAQGRCEGFMDQQIVVHYTGRSPDELETIRGACGASGGSWSD